MTSRNCQWGINPTGFGLSSRPSNFSKDFLGIWKIKSFRGQRGAPSFCCDPSKVGNGLFRSPDKHKTYFLPPRVTAAHKQKRGLKRSKFKTSQFRHSKFRQTSQIQTFQIQILQIQTDIPNSSIPNSDKHSKFKHSKLRIFNPTCQPGAKLWTWATGWNPPSVERFQKNLFPRIIPALKITGEHCGLTEEGKQGREGQDGLDPWDNLIKIWTQGSGQIN